MVTSNQEWPNTDCSAVTRAELAELLSIFIQPRTPAETLRVATAYAALKNDLPKGLEQDVIKAFVDDTGQAKDRTSQITRVCMTGMKGDMAGAIRVLLEMTGVRKEALVEVLARLCPKYPNAVQIP